MTLPDGLDRFLRLATRPVAARAYRRGQRAWQARWAAPDYSPPWRVAGPAQLPRELVDAVESAWFPVGVSLLDVGCGSGEIAAWLAARGYEVLGIDYAAPAVALARQRHGTQGGRLCFETVDICRAAPRGGRFGALLDRGCFQGIPRAFVADYVRHVGACADPEARFLLLCATRRPGRDPRPEARVYRDRADEVARLFQGLFEIDRMEPTTIARESGPRPDAAMPALAAWMVRRGRS